MDPTIRGRHPSLKYSHPLTLLAAYPSIIRSFEECLSSARTRARTRVSEVPEVLRKENRRKYLFVPNVKWREKHSGSEHFHHAKHLVNTILSNIHKLRAHYIEQWSGILASIYQLEKNRPRWKTFKRQQLAIHEQILWRICFPAD